MKCKNCNNEINDDMKFCIHCGSLQTEEDNEIHENTATETKKTSSSVSSFFESIRIMISNLVNNWKDQYSILVIIGMCVVAGFIGYAIKCENNPKPEKTVNKESEKTESTYNSEYNSETSTSDDNNIDSSSSSDTDSAWGYSSDSGSSDDTDSSYDYNTDSGSSDDTDSAWGYNSDSSSDYDTYDSSEDTSSNW